MSYHQMQIDLIASLLPAEALILGEREFCDISAEMLEKHVDFNIAWSISMSSWHDCVSKLKGSHSENTEWSSLGRTYLLAIKSWRRTRHRTDGVSFSLSFSAD